MRHYRIDVFGDRLRLFGPDGKQLDCRPLEKGEIDGLIAEVEKLYKTTSPNLAALGRRLYEWLDGPSLRWLEQARKGPPGLAVHIDVDGRLRHLPWELLCQDGVFLCGLPGNPFTPVRRVGDVRRDSLEPANRPLRVLFMACSPEDVKPVLSFEDEERLILDATRNQPIELVVEESGSLEGLAERIGNVGPDYFDVLHLSGHADIAGGVPFFVTEDDLGRRCDAKVQDLVRALKNRWPRVVFLSGCRTGQAIDGGAVPGLCEAMVQSGGPAVLGWALPVGDQAASLAAAEVYHHLAIGRSVDEAVAFARARLYEERSPYWHLLRLYADATEPAEIVTPLNTRGRERLHVRQASEEFLDAGAKSEVCPRSLFVGRRRPIQRCLRALRSHEGDGDYHEGVLLCGMGGLGKSSLAARLCERMPGYRRLVWVGLLDESQLLYVLADKLDSPEAAALLNEPRLTLKQRLRRVFQQCLAEKPVLLVFDDFEQNVERDSQGNVRVDGQGRAILQPAAAEVLRDVLEAIRDTASESRVIVTCRYGFVAPSAHARLYEEPLEQFRGADLEKKLALLPAFTSGATVDPDLRQRAKDLAAGNPRLLERLNRVLGDKAIDCDAILKKLEHTADEFREEIFLDALVGQQTPECRRLLALLSVVWLPVDRSAVVAIAGSHPVDPHLPRAVALGLAEAGLDPSTQSPRYFVSAILAPVLADALAEADRLEACRRAAQHLHQVWWVKAGHCSLEQALEVHRLAILAHEKGIAVTVAHAVARDWIYRNRYREAEGLCRITLTLGDDYRILHDLARAEQVLGRTSDARQHFEAALQQCPPAIADASVPDVRERAAIMHNLADLLQQQGDVARALKLWEESLALEEQIGSVWGKAVTLANMAWAAGKEGDAERQRQLNLQAAAALGSARAWLDLVTVLGNLGVSNEADAVVFAAQASWLATCIEVPIEDAVSLNAHLVSKLGIDHPASPLLATHTLFVTQVRGEGHPKREEIQRLAAGMLVACAEARQVAPEKFREWIESEGLNDPSRFLPALEEALEKMVGPDQWLFDRSLVSGGA